MRVIQTIRRFLAREDGLSSVEFVIAFPAFILLFLSVFESGLLMSRYVMLERGLDVTVRAIRTAPTGAVITHDTVREMICDNTIILPDCEDDTQIELVSIPTDTWTLPESTADCIDRESEVEPVVSFTPGVENEIMFIRVCYVVDPLFPSSGLGLRLKNDPTGGYRMIVTSAFANEPG